MTDINQLIGPLRAVGEPELRAVVVGTVTGSTTVSGTSGALGNDTDTALLLGLRHWCDVVLVGSATVKAENYGGVRISGSGREQRRAGGQATVPPIAVVSSSLNFDVNTRFFLEAETPPLILTDNPDPGRQSVLRSAGARILQVSSTDAEVVVDKLRAEGFARISCEGGPSLYAQVLTADLVDLWHHTVDPTLTGSVEHPLVRGGSREPRRFRLEHWHVDPDSVLFLRYRRDPGDAGSVGA